MIITDEDRRRAADTLDTFLERLDLSEPVTLTENIRSAALLIIRDYSEQLSLPGDTFSGVVGRMPAR